MKNTYNITNLIIHIAAIIYGLILIYNGIYYNLMIYILFGISWIFFNFICESLKMLDKSIWECYTTSKISSLKDGNEISFLELRTRIVSLQAYACFIHLLSISSICWQLHICLLAKI